MSPFTHLFVTWVAADAAGLRGRERAIVTWCGVLPDLDGLGAVVDVANHGATDYYTQYHHVLLHGAFGALLIPTILCLLGRTRAIVWLAGVVAVHGHLLCDLVGSRGPQGEIWPIYYLGPFSQIPAFSWSGQWALNAWPNILLTVLLMAWILYRTVQVGYSPVGLVSERADKVFVETMKNRFGR